MSTSLKALGLALAALCALSAIAASAAQAEVHHTFTTNAASGSVIVEAKAESNQVFHPEPGGPAFTCEGYGTEAGVVTNNSTEVTGRSIYSECSTPLGGMTVNTEGCHTTTQAAQTPTATRSFT